MTRKPGWNRSKKTGRFISKAAFNRWYKKGGKRGPQKRRKVKAKEKYIEFEVAIQYEPRRGEGGFEITGTTPSPAQPRKRPRVTHKSRDTRGNTKRRRGEKKQQAPRHKAASHRLGKGKIEGKRRKK